MTNTPKPSLKARIRSKSIALGDAIWDHQNEISFVAGVAVGGVMTIVVAKDKIGKLKEELFALDEVAGDAIDFIESKGLRQEALDYIVTLPVTEVTRHFVK